MGSFFTNVQVAGGQDPTRTREHILAALDESARSEGFTAASADDKADRSILVGPPGPWIAIYDEATERQDERLLAKLTRQLSEVANATALSVLVHDSSELRLTLYRDGKQAARYESPRGLSKKASTKTWESLLVEGQAKQKLLAILGAKPIFQEETLARFAELIGLDSAQASLGYRYAEQELDHLGNPDLYTRLRFRSLVRPAHQTLAEGPPRVELFSHTDALNLFLGNALHTSLGVRNVGGPCKGVTVIAWGDAIEGGLVRVDRVELVIQGTRAECAIMPSKDNTLWTASFPDAEVPAGVASVDQSALRSWRGVKSLVNSSVHANIFGEVTGVGAGRLILSIYPDVTPTSERFGYVSRVTVSKPEP